YLADCLLRSGNGEEADKFHRKLSSYKSALENLRHDLHVVPDYPERRALSRDVEAIAQIISNMASN
ncbi:MAG TPA: hypothetical protein VE553_03010, partial [Candidatus Binatia bacterium]|nr:hypothetical protein [Candidatus Binatia bacterium]